MKPFVVFGLLLLILNPLCAEGEWELVYPEFYTSLPTEEILCIGSSPSEFLIGSRRGIVYRAERLTDGRPGDWIRIKLNTLRDILALHWLNNKWIIGCNDGGYPNGYGGFVVQDSPTWVQEDDPIKWLYDSVWPVQEGGGFIAMYELDYGRLIGIHPGSVLASDDEGQSWTEIAKSNKGLDAVALWGKVYMAEGVQSNGLTTLSLEQGYGTSSWDTVWSVSVPHANVEFDVMALNDAFDSDGRPREGPGRLFVEARFENGLDGTIYNLRVSQLFTTQGIEWLDHGSEIVQLSDEDVENSTMDWNPLNLPETSLHKDPIEHRHGYIVDNLHASGDRLESFSENGWETIFESRPDSAFQVETIAPGHKLSFVAINTQLVTLGRDGVATEENLPIENPDSVEWKQLLYANGTFYAFVSSDPEGLSIYSTINFSEWDDIGTPKFKNWYRSGGHKLIPINDRLFFYFIASRPISMHPEEWISTTGRSEFSNEWMDWETHKNDYYRSSIYFPQNHTWYYLRGSSIKMHTEDLEYDISLADLSPETYFGNTMKLSSPDGLHLFTYGGTAEFMITDLDGSVQYYHPWHFFPGYDYKIDNIQWANGWYYILGSAVLRTRDFVDYEYVDLPESELMKHVVSFQGYLYAFVQGAVYRRPLKHGFLDSVEFKPGWHHAEWLGWFQIINQELGDIDHLLFGKCWVKQESDLEYWIRTETLGWIWMNKDWSPWFWRMDDNHWYWLDQDGWPGRAWDYDDQEWEELKP